MLKTETINHQVVIFLLTKFYRVHNIYQNQSRYNLI